MASLMTLGAAMIDVEVLLDAQNSTGSDVTLLVCW